ncbi:MAG: hypothetical protein CYG60_02795 [Actinobacteria bacterium]|nr:MAG: hypothetical protein CYG60_02795 [Actinomycetota bacterium]
MITPHDESYRANADSTSPSSFGNRSPEPAESEAEGVNGEIARTHELLFKPRQVVELRAFKGRETVSGYFDDGEALIQKAVELDGRGYAVYVTVNKVDPDLLARAKNRVRKVYRQPTTSDTDVVRRRWLPLDFDPVRPAGVSSTDEEKGAALLRARQVRDYLRKKGWPEPLFADSGNGAHLLYPVDLPNDPESLRLVKGILEALAFQFSDGAVEVDTSNCNAARLWKLYGTTARKGDDTKERPHRTSRLLEAPEGAAAGEPVEREKLEAVAAMRPTVTSREERSRNPGRNGHKEFDLAEWIERHGVPVRREGPWGQGGYRYVLEECPWNGHMDNAAYIVRFANGAVAAGCHHNSCQGLGWRDFRKHYEPEAYDGRDGYGEEFGRARSQEEAPIPEPTPHPTLAEEAYHGLPGDVIRAIEPHTEADPVAVLANLLCAFGNAIGRGAYFPVGADKHHLKINAGLVGPTSKGRKGMSEGHVRLLMHAVDDAWEEERVMSGLASGEGLIYEVRDELWGVDGKGKRVLKDEGISDKRLFVSEPELARVLKVITRETNTLSPIVRQAWDSGRLRVMTRNNPLRATDAHVSIVGHISREELLRHLTETEAAGGFANRFLWLAVRRSKELPFGGEWDDVDTAPLVKRLSEALEFGRSAGEITWGETARDAWRKIYGPLSEGKPGLFGAVIGRAEAQVVRLSALYAVMDESYTVEQEHLEAALALWDYAEASARYIFGDATGDPVADQIVEALRAAGAEGMTRTEVSHLFKRHKSAERIDGALALLLKGGRVRREREETTGRTAERWYAR